MKTYSETMKSVLEKAAVITEEKHEKAQKRRKRLTDITSAAVMLALLIGAVLVIKPFGERGNGEQSGIVTLPDLKVTPDCSDDPEPVLTPDGTEPKESVEPNYITEKTVPLFDDSTSTRNVERVLAALEKDCILDADGGLFYVDADFSGIYNCTPVYFRESFPDIELFVYMTEYNERIYFIRHGDVFYGMYIEYNRINNMGLWDYDNNGVDDIVLSLFCYGDYTHQVIECIDLSKGIVMLIFERRADFPSSRYTFDYDGKNIYVDKLKLEWHYIGNASIGNKYCYEHVIPFDTERELIPVEQIYVDFGTTMSSTERERVNSIISNSGFILEDGRRVTNFNVDSMFLKCCTSKCVFYNPDGIELFCNIYDGAGFLKIGDEMYLHDTFGGHHIYMCLWDYDSNGVDDVVLVSEKHSDTIIHEALVFDVSTKNFKEIISRKVLLESGFTFNYDGENIYIYQKKVEYSDGEFRIDGMRVNDYFPDKPIVGVEPADEPMYQPSYNSFYTKLALVKAYDDGDLSNTELALSLLKTDGYIEASTGELRDPNHYNTSNAQLRNCTSDYVRKYTPDVELFQDNFNEFFLLLGNKLYHLDSAAGAPIYMCLWDYDDNGVDDAVLCSAQDYEVSYFEMYFFDVNTNSVAEIISLDEQVSIFRFSGKSIEIFSTELEYIDGEFYIHDMKIYDYFAWIHR